MVTLIDAPCGWDVDDCPCGGIEVTDEDKAIAVQILWDLTGRRFGPCEVTVRPCQSAIAACGRCGGYPMGPRLCGCRSVPEVVLPGPVHSIVEVLVDGIALEPEAYRVDDFAWLVRLDGGVWPFCQDLTADADASGAFAVTYLIGAEPPAGAAQIAGELACDIARARCQDDECRLPRRATQAVRQGVTVTMADLPDGKTGIEIVDLWVSAINLKRRRSTVYSPDMPKVRQTTWQAGGSE